jgi:hypothetical protein
MMPGMCQANIQFGANDQYIAAAIESPQIRLYRYRSGWEFRSITHSGPSGKEGFVIREWLAEPANGRLIALSTANNEVAIIDRERGEAIATLPGYGALRFLPDGSLWTFGADGVLRWPCRKDAEGRPNRFGPPELIHPDGSYHLTSMSSDGRVFAIPHAGANSYAGATVFDAYANHSWRVGPQQDVRSCAVSPDGRWIASGSHALSRGGGAKVWEMLPGHPRLVKELPVLGLCGVKFSPDGQWLLTSGGGPRIWRVGDWEEGPALGGTADNMYTIFSPDGKLLALGDEPGVIRLVAPHSGEELARLTAPVKNPLHPEAFSSDGSELYVVDPQTRAMHIFDLRLIRTQLAEMGLDWDPASIPPPFPKENVPFHIEVDRGDAGLTKEQWRAYWQRQLLTGEIRLAFNPLDVGARFLRGRARHKLEQPVAAVDDFSVGLAFNPPVEDRFVAGVPTSEITSEFNGQAWDWAVQATSNADAPDARKILHFAQKAVELAPEQCLYRNTLGVVYYRLGRYAEALEHLKASLQSGNGSSDAFDLFFIAMCQHRLGRAEAARNAYEQALRWIEGERAYLPEAWLNELDAFQCEAEAVLHDPTLGGNP